MISDTMTLKYSPISFDMKEEYEARRAATPEKTSDYSFVNLYGWGSEYGLEWAFDGPLVWIRETSPKLRYWAPVGNWHEYDFSSVIAANDIHDCIRVPHALANLWEDTLQCTVIEDRGQWDYVYDTEKLIGLRGNKLHKKKNHLNRFKKMYSYSYETLTEERIPEVLEFQRQWMCSRECRKGDPLSSEDRVVRSVFSEWRRLPLMGGIVRVDGKIIAYTVAEALTDEMLLIHFEKADTNYRGSYQAINQLFLEHEGQGYTSVDREQDFGDEGMRHAKSSYHPERFLKKYRIEF
jgi:hypothetical protein